MNAPQQPASWGAPRTAPRHAPRFAFCDQYR